MASILNWQVFITFLISSILFISRLTFIYAIDKGWYIILWFGLRPAGGVKHSDSDLVETRMLSAKKALR